MWADAKYWIVVFGIVLVTAFSTGLSRAYYTRVYFREVEPDADGWLNLSPLGWPWAWQRIIFSLRYNGDGLEHRFFGRISYVPWIEMTNVKAGEMLWPRLYLGWLRLWLPSPHWRGSAQFLLAAEARGIPLDPKFFADPNRGNAK